jgi:hypothetical protein
MRAFQRNTLNLWVALRSDAITTAFDFILAGLNLPAAPLIGRAQNSFLGMLPTFWGFAHSKIELQSGAA